MIEVKGAYLLRASVGSYTDFLTEANLIAFVSIEEAGNVLPTCKMCFACEIEALIYQFQEGSVFNVSIGRTQDQMSDYSFRIVNITITKTQISYNVEISAVLDALGYLVQGRVITFPKDNAVATIKKIAEKYFSWNKSNIVASKDLQPWIQYGQTDKKMIDDMWLFADLGETDVPLCAITATKSFIFRSVLLNNGKYDWKFSTIPDQTNKTVSIMSDYLVESMGNLTNLWAAYGRKKLVYDLEEGVSEDTLFKPKPFLALTKEVSRAQGIEYTVTEAGTVGKNVHKNYWKSYYTNLSNLAMLSSLHLNLSIRNVYNPIKLLDRVMFTDYGIDGTAKTGGPYAGIYFITRIVRQITDKEMYTQVELTRDAINKAI